MLFSSKKLPPVDASDVADPTGDESASAVLFMASMNTRIAFFISSCPSPVYSLIIFNVSNPIPENNGCAHVAARWSGLG